MKKKIAMMRKIMKRSVDNERIIRRKDSQEEVSMFAAKIYAISAKAAKSRRKRGGNNPKVRMMKKMRRKILIMVTKSRLSNHGQSVWANFFARP